MKMAYAERTLESNSVQSAEFSYKDSGKVFHAFISGLYSDKIKSITREIWSNAFDAHVEAGIPDKPFEVTFPSAFNLTFRVRDFGLGMDHDFMMGGYTLIGNSTKDQSNSQVGGFGWGRLSPLSYTDSYTIMTYSGGIGRAYAVVLSEEGRPQVNYNGDFETDEPDGTMITFPIKTSDAGIFTQKAKEVSKGFDVKPIIKPHRDDITLDDKEVVLKGTFWERVKGYSNTSYAKMGCAMYPIDQYQFTEEVRKVLQKNLIITFTIGALSVTASRENLSYGSKEPTVASIIKAVKDIQAEVGDIFLDSVKQATSMWNAMELYMEGSLSGMLSKEVLEQADYGNGELKNFLSHKSSFIYATPISHSSMGRYVRPSRFDYRIFLSFSNACLIVSRKGDVRASARIKGWFRDIANTYEYYIWKHCEGTGDETDLSNFFSLAPEVPVYYVKDMKDPGPNKRITPNKVSVKDLRNAYWYDIDLKDGLFEKGGVYVKLSNNNSQSNYNLGFVGEVCEKLGQRVYGVPKTLWKGFESAPQWEVVDKYIHERLIKGIVRERVNIKKYETYFSQLPVDFAVLPLNVQVPHPPKKIVKSYPSYHTYIEGHPTCKEYEKKIHNVVTELKEKYPALLFLASRGADQDLLTHYVECVNKCNQFEIDTNQITVKGD